MKHNPIALGFTAFAALSLTVACNVDPNRVDNDVDNTILKKKCAAEKAQDVQAVNQNRLEMLGDYKPAQTRNLTISKGKVDSVGEMQVVKAQTDNEVIKVETDCPTLSASLTVPGGETTDGYKIKDVTENSMLLVLDSEDKKERVLVETKEVTGDMNDLSSEDGLNQIKLTRTDLETGAVKIQISQTFEKAGELQPLTQDEYKLLMSSNELTVSQKTVSESIASQATGTPLKALDGTVRLSLEELEDIQEETN